MVDDSDADSNETLKGKEEVMLFRQVARLTGEERIRRPKRKACPGRTDAGVMYDEQQLGMRDGPGVRLVHASGNLKPGLAVRILQSVLSATAPRVAQKEHVDAHLDLDARLHRRREDGVHLQDGCPGAAVVVRVSTLPTPSILLIDLDLAWR